MDRSRRWTNGAGRIALRRKSETTKVRRLLIMLGLAFALPVASANPVVHSDPRDFSGTWRDWKSTIGSTQTDQMFVIGVDLPYKPATQNLTADRLEEFKAGRDRASPHLTCRPTGVQGITAQKGAMLVLQSAKEIAFLFEDDREVRHVYMDQQHPTDVKPSYTGDSVGRWEGDALVVDTIGYNGKGLLDEIGTPHGTQLHLVERFTKSKDGQTLTDELTFADPEYYTKSFTKTRIWSLRPGERLRDYDCAENPREDDFNKLTYENDWFKPTCVRPVKDGKSGEKVVCSNK